MNLIVYGDTLQEAIEDTVITGSGILIERDRKHFFIGNGGSAAIASHMATDFSNKAGISALALTDLSALTCVSNDYGYGDVFERQLGWHANQGERLFAISSSGKSENILNAAKYAGRAGLIVVTLSGFAADNPLRQLGDVNFYVPSSSYGIVETAHLAILHALLEDVAK
jgi:D-sedoheptulose 7-phosphate isomerase